MHSGAAAARRSESARSGRLAMVKSSEQLAQGAADGLGCDDLECETDREGADDCGGDQGDSGVGHRMAVNSGVITNSLYERFHCNSLSEHEESVRCRGGALLETKPWWRRRECG